MILENLVLVWILLVSWFNLVFVIKIKRLEDELEKVKIDVDCHDNNIWNLISEVVDLCGIVKVQKECVDDGF